MIAPPRRSLTFAVIGVAAVTGLAGCSASASPAGSAGTPQTNATAASTPEATTWPLNVDVPASGAPSWVENLPSQWDRRVAGDSTVYVNGLCRLTLRNDALPPEATGDEGGTTLIVGRMRTLFEQQVPQISNASFTPTESRWIAVDGVPAEFGTLEFTYTMEASSGEQKWTAFYAGRGFAKAQRGLGALAECQGEPLSDGDRAMLTSVLDGLAVTTS